MLESSSPGRTLKTTHTAYPATKNGRRNIYARIIKPWQKVEDDTHCIPCYKEWEEKYARISKPWLKVEDYTHCIPCYKSIGVASSGAYDLKAHFETASHNN